MTKLPLAWLLCLALLPMGLACQQRGKNSEVTSLGDSNTRPSTVQSRARRPPDLIKINGVFVPTRRVKIKSEFSGRLDNLAVAKGQAVLRQSPLFRVEDDRLTESLGFLRSQLQLAQTQLEQSSLLSEVEATTEEVQERVAVELPALASVEEVPAYREPTFSGLASEVRFTSEDAGGVWPEIDPRVIERSNDPQDAGGIWPSYGVRETVGGEEFYSGWSSFFAAASVPMPSRPEEFTAAQNSILIQAAQPLEMTSEAEIPSVSAEADSLLSLYRARIDLMRAELAVMENESMRREVFSPLDGRVHELLVSEGSNVEAGDLLAEIYQVDPIEFSFQIPKDQVDFLELGMTVRGQLSDLPDITFEGEISYIAPELNPDGENVEVRARIGNSDDGFKVGAKGRAEIGFESKVTAQTP